MTPAELAQIRAASETLTDAWALEFPGRFLSTTARVTLLAIVRGENRFGDSPGFQGSNNWGSVTCFRHDFGCIKAGDRDVNGNPVTASFQRYPSQLEGARGFLRVLLRKKKNAVPIDGFDVVAVARAMYANGYYTGVQGTADDRIFAYGKLIASNAVAVRAALGVSYVGAGIALVVALVGLSWFAWRTQEHS